MTREEAVMTINYLKEDYKQLLTEEDAEALDMAIEALEGVCFDEWCDDCKEYDTEKNCCPRFNRVIRGAMNREPSENGTLEVKVEDATKVGRVLISDDKHRGGLYYPDEDEPQGDLISRAEAIDALRYAQHRFTVADEAGGMGSVKWSENVIYFAAAERVLTELPSAGRPKGESLLGTEMSLPKWIPVSEKPKDENRTYLVQLDGGGMRSCRWTNTNPFWTDLATEWHWNIFDIPQYSKVVAWMDLEPYKGGEDE